eukprot:TRINITY_DN10703_c0_g1_i2.p1 TRINITY_DN10703_c0_g1~~TRINITY_DN10703_c0_g1_i2.p1  ORF type:complete len:494 (-),score=68.09 TRINITY_DN10703_c0_g1_i2:342-1823(-)
MDASTQGCFRAFITKYGANGRSSSPRDEITAAGDAPVLEIVGKQNQSRKKTRFDDPSPTLLLSSLPQPVLSDISEKSVTPSSITRSPTTFIRMKRTPSMKRSSSSAGRKDSTVSDDSYAFVPCSSRSQRDVSIFSANEASQAEQPVKDTRQSFFTQCRSTLMDLVDSRRQQSFFGADGADDGNKLREHISDRTSSCVFRRAVTTAGFTQHEGNFLESYTIKDELGSGAFGVVWLAICKSTKQLCAVKCLSLSSISDQAELDMEIAVFRKLDHPNVAHLRECLKETNKYFLAMDHYSGGDLVHAIEHRWFAYSDKAITKFIWQMLSGIAYLHYNKIIHRDVKAENYVLESSSRDAPLRLIDFGMACIYDKKKDKKLTELVGTAYAIAPEVLDGLYDEKCDIWSIGVVIYFLAAGHRPFEGTDEELCAITRRGDVPSFTGFTWAMHSKRMQDLVMAMRKADPAARPSAVSLMARQGWLKKGSHAQNGSGCKCVVS